jgi:hypothetical protein
VGQITEASGEQNSGLEQINSAIHMMSQVTQANASGSEETASASEELTAQSAELRAGVDVLIKLVKGQSFADSQQKEKASSKPSEPLKKSEPPLVKHMDLTHRKNYPVTPMIPNGNGHNGNGHNGNGHNGNAHNGNGQNGNGQNGTNYDDSFFDM